ncbi:hypothetical protein CAI18_06785 [Xanthomonas citri pv. punicae]|nr:hypothetical protein CAI18_06785 [Xanthomonas citri pv. punicae]
MANSGKVITITGPRLVLISAETSIPSAWRVATCSWASCWACASKKSLPFFNNACVAALLATRFSACSIANSFLLSSA